MNTLSKESMDTTLAEPEFVENVMRKKKVYSESLLTVQCYACQGPTICKYIFYLKKCIWRISWIFGTVVLFWFVIEFCDRTSTISDWCWCLYIYIYFFI